MMYINDIHHLGLIMSRNTAKLFMHGRSQAVRLPKEFRLPGTEVEISRDGDVVQLKPILEPGKIQDWQTAFDRIDALGPIDDFPEGWREQRLLPAETQVKFD
jgi:antitoxin VapB